MGVEELKDNFLISMGCSISNTYNYINDDGYDYFAKIDKKDVKINNKVIPMKKTILNTMCLNSDLTWSGMKALENVLKKIVAVPEKNHNNEMIEELVNYTINAGKLYFLDWVKYATAKLKIDENLLQYLITLVHSSICDLNNNIVEILNKYQINLTNAKIEAMKYQNQKNAETIADAANAQRNAYATTYTYDSLFGSGKTSYTYASTSSNVNSNILRGQFDANSVMANMFNESGQESAYQKAISEISNVFEKVILNFNGKIIEILVLKLPKLFSEEVLNNVPNLEINPTNTKEWMKIIPELNDEELEELCKIAKFYCVDLYIPLEERLSKDMCDYFIKEGKTDYVSNNLKLYSLLEEKEIITFPELSDKLYKHFMNQILKRDNLKTIKSTKIAKKIFEEDKKTIESCKYLIEKDKKALIKKCDDISEKWKSKNKSDKLWVMGLSAAIVIIPILVLLVIKYFFVIYDYFNTLINGLGILIALILGFGVFVAVPFWLCLAYLFLIEIKNYILNRI